MPATKHDVATKAGAKSETKLNFTTDPAQKEERCMRAEERKASAGKHKFTGADKAHLTRGSAASALDGLPGSAEESIHAFVVTRNGGKDSIDLKTFRGRPVLVINIASKCGKTEAGYKTLSELHSMFHKKGKGLEILAVPWNQFGKQEPGDYAEVCAFAKSKGAEFTILDKADVNGDEALPLYNFLKASTSGKRISWNFEAFLCDKDGRVAKRFSPGPSFETVKAALDQLKA